MSEEYQLWGLLNGVTTGRSMNQNEGMFGRQESEIVPTRLQNFVYNEHTSLDQIKQFSYEDLEVPSHSEGQGSSSQQDPNRKVSNTILLEAAVIDTEVSKTRKRPPNLDEIDGHVFQTTFGDEPSPSPVKNASFEQLALSRDLSRQDSDCNIPTPVDVGQMVSVFEAKTTLDQIKEETYMTKDKPTACPVCGEKNRNTRCAECLRREPATSYNNTPETTSKYESSSSQTKYPNYP